MCWEGGKGGRAVSRKGGKGGTIIRQQDWRGWRVVTWKIGKERGGRVVRRWQDGKGERVVRWQGGKGRRVVNWQGGRFLVSFKSGRHRVSARFHLFVSDVV